MECNICLDNISSASETRRLPCYWSHVFCLSCLKDVIKSKNIGGYFRCPICQHSIKYPEGGIETFRIVDVKKSCMENYQDEIRRETERLKLKRKADIDELNKHFKCFKQSVDNYQNSLSNKLNTFYNNVEEIYRKTEEDIQCYTKSESSASNSVQPKKLITSKEKITSALDENLSKKVLLNLHEPNFECGRLLFSHKEEPDKEYFREMPESFQVFGGKNCFLITYDRHLYEWNNTDYNGYLAIDFTEGAIDNENEFYTYTVLPEKIEDRGTVTHWNHQDKSFQSVLNKEEKQNVYSDKFLCFTCRTNLILFGINSCQLIDIDLHYDLSCWTRKFIKGGYLYFLRDSINFQYCPIKMLIDDKSLMGNNILVKINYEQVSIRNDIIEEVINYGKTLLTNEEFVFVLNAENKSAIAYPQRNVFRGGQLISYFHTDKDIHFCILYESITDKHCFVKSYLLEK